MLNTTYDAFILVLKTKKDHPNFEIAFWSE